MILEQAVIYSEDELARFLKKKDRSVFNYLYMHYAASLYKVIKDVVRDDHTAEDVLQEVFVKIWMSLDRYDEKKGRIYTWLRNVARNAAIDSLRSKGEIMKQKIGGVDSVWDLPCKTPFQTDTIGMKTLISELRPDCQTIMTMVYYLGYTISEVSKALVVPEGTVKTRIRASLKQLRYNFSVSSSVQ